MSDFLAPNGEKSNLTPEQWKLVRTPSFKEWFGDWENDPETASKVVDENGEPLVVWRGESKDFNVFEYKKLGSSLKTAWRNAGFYFSPTKSGAEQYMFFMGSRILKQFFLNIKNQYTLDSQEFFGVMDWGSLPTQKFKTNKSATDFAIKRISEIKSENYDGAFVTVLENNNVVEIIAFEPNQIKLADGSNTKFDAGNPDIRYADGGKVKKVKFDIESREDEEDRTTISINGIGEVILIETFPEYEFLEDVGEDGLEELGVEEGDIIGKIEHLEIEDEYKGQGYAKLLMEKAIEVAKEKGLMPLYLNASPMGSKRYGLNIEDLTGFYESLGFEVFLRQGGNNLMILKNTYKNGGLTKNNMENKIKFSKEEHKDFNFWKQDGNVSKNEDGSYSTQDAQWTNRLKDLDALKQYYYKEFLSDNNRYKGGGKVVYLKGMKTKIWNILKDHFLSEKEAEKNEENYSRINVFRDYDLDDFQEVKAFDKEGSQYYYDFDKLENQIAKILKDESVTKIELEYGDFEKANTNWMILFEKPNPDDIFQEEEVRQSQRKEQDPDDMFQENEYADGGSADDKHLIAKAIEFIIGSAIDTNSIEIEPTEISYKRKNTNVRTSIDKKLIEDTIRMHGTSLKGRYARGGVIEVVGRGNKGAFRNKDFEGMTEKEVIQWWEERGYKLSKTKSESSLKPYTFYINKFADGGQPIQQLLPQPAPQPAPQPVQYVVQQPAPQPTQQGVSLNSAIDFVKENPQVLMMLKNGGEAGFDDTNTSMVIYHEEKGNFMIPKNQIYLWLYEGENASEKIESGEYDFVMYPYASLNMSGQRGFIPPLKKIWTKKFQKQNKGSEHLIGVIKAHLLNDGKELYIDMMSVNPSLKKHGVMSYMIKDLRDTFNLTQDQVTFSTLTDEGKKFVAKKTYADGGVAQFPPKGELTNKDNFLLKYEKRGGEYEFLVYKPITKEVSGYNQIKHVCLNKDCPQKMTYEQFINYLYAELYLDDTQYANGGEIVKFYTKENERLGRPSGSMEKEILDKVRDRFEQNQFIGSMGWKTPQGKLADGYLYKLDDFDKNVVSNIRLKTTEKIFRYFNRTTAIGGITPFIKINLENGMLYFDNSDNNDIQFETKGVKALWVSLIEDNMEYADGGDVPHEDKMFQLPLEMVVYVPSTQDVDKVISVDKMDKRVDEVKEYLASKFGGYTSSDKLGGYVDSTGNLVNEDVVQVTSFSTQEAYNENKEELIQQLAKWGKQWGQEAIGFEFEGDLMYVPQEL